MRTYSDLFAQFSSTAFRLETKAEYRVDEEEEAFSAFRAGRPVPTEWHDDWLSFLVSTRNTGRRIQRVRVVPSPATDYFNFEVDYGYLPSSRAGEEIRLIQNEAIKDDLNDFWLFDSSVLGIPNYTDEGLFLGGRVDDSPATVAACSKIAELLWEQAVPLETYLKDR